MTPSSYQEPDTTPPTCHRLSAVPATSDHKKPNQMFEKWFWGVQGKYSTPQRRFTWIMLFYGEAGHHTLQPKQTKIPQTELSVFDNSTILLESYTCHIHTCVVECSTDTSHTCKPLQAKALRGQYGLNAGLTSSVYTTGRIDA